MSVVRVSSRLLAPFSSSIRSQAATYPKYNKFLASGSRKGFIFVGAAALSSSSGPSVTSLPHAEHSNQLRKYSKVQNNQNSMSGQKSISTHEITKNLTLWSSQPRNIEKDASTLKLKHEVDKPLVVLITWLLAKRKHIAKYVNIYTELGYDVLSVEMTPWQLLWPTKGSQLIAADLIKFLENNTSYSPLILHGFSVGGYMWGECMVQMARDLQRYEPVLNRIVAQVWDSAADITEIPIGFPKSMFPRNPTLQRALRNYCLYHMKTFHHQATTHYIRSSQLFHSPIAKAPVLFFVSKNDPIGAVNSNHSVREGMESLGMKCTWKCWDKSSHVGHFYHHTEEYLEYLFKHLNDNNVGRKAERSRAKL